MAAATPNSDVIVEVELVFFTLRRRLGLTLSCFKAATTGELPSDAAERVLSDIRARTSLHRPVFVDAFVHEDRQAERPTLSLTHVVIGSTPSDSAEGIVPVTVDSDDERIDHRDAVDAARQVAIDLMGRLPISTVLAPQRDAAFTLSDLIAVHSAFLGPGVALDRSNFRRRVESIPGYVERVDPPDWFTPDAHRRGRPESWYVAGDATELDPPLRFG
jgi:hypothetical protein